MRNFVFKTRKFALKTRNCASRTRNFALKMMNCALKTRNFALKMMNCAGTDGRFGRLFADSRFGLGGRLD